MILNKQDKNKSGIYCIFNKYNGKVYIGKSKNIYNRIRSHIYCLNKRSKDENRYLINSWFKYGSDNFEYFVLEYLELDENLLYKQELYWIEFTDSTNRKYGYNLRKDSSTKMIVHEDTRLLQSKITKGSNNPNYNNKWSNEQKQKMSIKIKEQFQNGRTISKEQCLKGVASKQELWKTNPQLKQNMINKVRIKNTKYKIYQYTKNMELLKVWNCVNDIIIDNPTYKRHNIYAVCSGEKKSIYGYIWKKVLIDDIVQLNQK